MKKKCSKCGKSGHFAKTCGRDPKETARRSHKRKHPNSWVKDLSEKFETASEGESSGATDIAGAFADLPPVNVTPVGGETTEETAQAGAGEGDTATSAEAPKDANKAKPKNPAEDINADEMADMIGQAYAGVLMQGSEYCAANGGVGLGKDFCKLAGGAMTLLVKKHAADMGIQSEDAALIVVVGTGGFVGYQCYRVKSKIDKAAKEAAGATAPKDAPNGKPSDNGKPEPERPERPAPSGPIAIAAGGGYS